MVGSPRSRLAPPLWLTLALAALVGAVVYVRATNATGERALDNAITALAVILGGLLYGLWLLFGAGLTGRARLGLLFAAALVAGLVAATVRIDGWTGASLPELRFAWTPPRAAELAGGSVTAEATARTAGASPFDFPGFLGPGRDAVVRGVKLARDWAQKPPELLWRVDVGAGWSGFAVVAGVAFTQEQRGAEQLVVARDLATGAELWRTAHAAYFDHVLGGPGPRATPTVADGRVYAHDALGHVECLDAATGARIWERDLKRDYGMTDALEEAKIAFGRSPSPLVYGALVIVPAGGDPDGRRAGLVALDRETGATVWEGPPRDISHASPQIATLAGIEQVLVVNADTVSGHDPRDGRLIWEHPWPGQTSAAANNSQPVALPPDRVLVSKGYGQGSLVLQLAAASDGALQATPVWSSKRALRTKLTNAAVRDGYAYALSDGILECVSLADGERVWRDGRYDHGQVLLVDDLLLVVTEEGEVLLIEATPERANSVLGRFQAVTGKTWNTLALSRDVLLVRNGVEATAWRLPLAAD